MAWFGRIGSWGADPTPNQKFDLPVTAQLLGSNIIYPQTMDKTWFLSSTLIEGPDDW